MSDKFRNRIVERIHRRAGDILPNLRNPKTHEDSQLNTLTSLFSRFGIVDALIAYRSDRNGGELTYFDGHGRHMVDPEQVWPVDVTDLTDEEVDQLVLYFDEVGAMATRSPERLAALLREADLEDDHLARLAALTAKNARIDIAGILGMGDLSDSGLASLMPAPSMGTLSQIAPTYAPAPVAGGEETRTADAIPLADIRMLQLFFTTAQREEFMAMAEELAPILGAASTTDTAMEAMRYAHSQLTQAH